MHLAYNVRKNDLLVRLTLLADDRMHQFLPEYTLFCFAKYANKMFNKINIFCFLVCFTSLWYIFFTNPSILLTYNISGITGRELKRALNCARQPADDCARQA
jgi:hypothetical protein